MQSIEIHSSVAKLDLEKVLTESLKANRLDPKLLYVTPRQADLWREVSQTHSPVHTDPEFARIYRDAYAKIAPGLPKRIHIVGLGPGLGIKEADLAVRLREDNRELRFTAIDVSKDLAEEAATRVFKSSGAEAERHLVCDLAELSYVRSWLDAGDGEWPRLFTFFGMVPNLEPQFVAKLLRELLRPGDVVLASVHLAPVGGSTDVAAAMNKVLPQYDNAETLAWLRAAMEQWMLTERMGEPRIVPATHTKIPCIRGMAAWNAVKVYTAPEPALDGFTDILFQLFYSLRYTPTLFEELLRHAGVRGEMLAMTACREEAIWAVRSA